MDVSKTQLIESVFAGGSEMAARMRAFDWSTTPLGPLERWPQSLRTCVRIVLGSGYPMCIHWGPDYTLLYNDEYRPLLGTKHPTALGCRSRDVVPEAWDFIGPLFERIMVQGHAFSTLTDYLVPLNRNNYLEACYFALSFSPIPDDKGGVGGVLGTALETTERVFDDRRQRLLRDLASRTAETRGAEEVWRVSAETLGEHRLSAPFAFLYEYRPSEHQAHLVGTSVETNTDLHPEVIDCRTENLWRFDSAMTRDGAVAELENRASRVSVENWGGPPKQASVVPIRLGRHSEAMGFLVVGIHPGRAFDDAYRQFVNRIAEQIAIGLASARAYEQERQRAEALAELDRAKTTFFSNISHEFRTPLTLMLGPLEEALSEGRERLNPERHEQLVTVRRNALRLLKLVNTLLDFSRIEAGRVQAVYEPTDLAGITSEIASAFRSAIENAGLRFSVECQPIAEPIYVDRDMWEKVVLNLLSNAFKFTFDGEVAVALKSVDGAVELQVRDTGVGIPEEHRERIFERFHRIEGTLARTYEGAGIGLALVQELVKLHGGSLRVESAVGYGSTFTVTIPRGLAHLPAERIQATRSLASTAAAVGAYADEALRWLPNDLWQEPSADRVPKAVSLAETGPRRELIIVADDNSDMRQFLKRLLDERYEVHPVTDGREALELTRRLRPGLVLADAMMPRLDGFGLLRAIREDSALASTPVILLSAQAGEESRVKGLQQGADDYLVKPFAARELLARVDVNLKMSNLRRETAEREERLRGEAADVRLIVDMIPGLVCTATPAGVTELVNRQMREYFGKALEELQAWATADIVHPDDLANTIAAWTHSVETGDLFDIDHRLRRPDGSDRWFHTRGVCLRDAKGRIVRWYILLTDVDDRKRAEESLKLQVQVLQNMPVNAWTVLPDGMQDFTNQQWLEYTGLTMDRFLSSPQAWMSALHPDDHERAAAAFWGGIRSGSAFTSETRFRRISDGEYRWHLNRGIPLRDSAGNLIKFVGTSTDIEDVKRAERELRQLIDFLPQHVLVLDKDGTLLQVNKTMLDYKGFTLEEMKGRGTRERINRDIHPDDLERVQKERSAGLSRGVPFESEKRLLGKDGQFRWFLFRYNPVLNEAGDIVRWFATATDIEDRKQAEDRIRNEAVALREQIDRESMFEDIVGSSEVLRKVLRQVATVARTDSTVLICGETGTGKELIARAIHKRSLRSDQAFVSVNCASIPPSLIASELFGHEKGAFTGALQQRRGRFELANGGTIFLDEIGELPVETQIALLRVLQERQFERVGGSKTISVDVRVVAATNRDLSAAIAAGTFRADLFYRLNVFPIQVPPLRLRRDDIPMLVEYFVKRFAEKMGKQISKIDKNTMDLCQKYLWPGNIRELQNIVERSVILCGGNTFSIDEAWLSVNTPPGVSVARPMGETLQDHERELIEAALAESKGRVAGPNGAAAKLGIPRSTLDRKIQQLKIKKRQFLPET